MYSNLDYKYNRTKYKKDSYQYYMNKALSILRDKRIPRDERMKYFEYYKTKAEKQKNKNQNLEASEDQK